MFEGLRLELVMVEYMCCVKLEISFINHKIKKEKMKCGRKSVHEAFPVKEENRSQSRGVAGSFMPNIHLHQMNKRRVLLRHGIPARQVVKMYRAGSHGRVAARETKAFQSLDCDLECPSEIFRTHKAKKATR